jgi:hypothetical protein
MGRLIKGGDLDQHRLYRITNFSEIHNGFRYNTGTNEDNLPFNPSGSCSSGGLYFFDIKYIVQYHNSNCDGYWIRGVSLDNDEEIWDEENGKYKAHTITLGERTILDNFEIPVEYCMEAVKNNVGALEYVKDQTEDICMEAAKQNGYALKYVKEQT